MGKITAIRQAFNEGKTDYVAIAQETGASLATVKTQWSRWKKMKKQSESITP